MRLWIHNEILHLLRISQAQIQPGPPQITLFNRCGTPFSHKLIRIKRFRAHPRCRHPLRHRFYCHCVTMSSITEPYSLIAVRNVRIKNSQLNGNTIFKLNYNTFHGRAIPGLLWNGGSARYYERTIPDDVQRVVEWRDFCLVWMWFPSVFKVCLSCVQF